MQTGCWERRQFSIQPFIKASDSSDTGLQCKLPMHGAMYGKMRALWGASEGQKRFVRKIVE